MLQGNLAIPADHIKVCQQANTPTVGNAAGNTQNYLDLTGAPTVAPEYDYGYVLQFLLLPSSNLLHLCFCKAGADYDYEDL